MLCWKTLCNHTVFTPRIQNPIIYESQSRKKNFHWLNWILDTSSNYAVFSSRTIKSKMGFLNFDTSFLLGNLWSIKCDWSNYGYLFIFFLYFICGVVNREKIGFFPLFLSSTLRYYPDWVITLSTI